MATMEEPDFISKFTLTEPHISDLFQFFESKFKVVRIHNEFTREFKVFPKETLVVSISQEEDPYQLDFGTYNIILFKDPGNLITVRVYGTLRTGKGRNYVQRSISDRSLISRLRLFEYVNTEVNPYLLLFNENEEERFVKGTLEKWERKEDGSIKARCNIGELCRRRKLWRERNPSERLYSLQECKKAKCIHLMSQECEYLLTPTNDKSHTKLLKATGYCFEYLHRYQHKFEAKALDYLKQEQKKIISRVTKILTQLEYTSIELFVQNITSPFFDQKLFTCFLSILNELKSNSNNKNFQIYSKELTGIESGLSADPLMVRSISELNKVSIISNSDCHSTNFHRLGREATTIKLNKLNYHNLVDSFFLT